MKCNYTATLNTTNGADTIDAIYAGNGGLTQIQSGPVQFSDVAGVQNLVDALVADILSAGGSVASATYTLEGKLVRLDWE